MKVGIGYANAKDALLSGRAVAEQALRAGAIQQPGLAIAFCGGTVDHDAFHRGLQDVLGGGVPIIGGSAIGVITGTDLSYSGYPMAAAVIEPEKMEWRVSAVENIDRDGKLAGRNLAGKLSSEPDDRLLAVLYDSIREHPSETTPPILNASAPILDGICELHTTEVPIIGAGLLGDYVFSCSKQFCGSHVGRQQLVGLMLGGEIDVYFRIMHGCTPLDGIYHHITRIEGSVIYEIDGLPAVEVIDTKYHNRNWRSEHPLKLLSIGINYGPRYGKPTEENYVNRLITGAMPDGAGIGLFESDLSEGMEFQFMLRDSSEMIESVKTNTRELLHSIESNGQKPSFGLYIDCAGRTAVQSATLTEEASEVQKFFVAGDIPLLGFYSGVEIAPLVGKSRGLDWTAVLAIFAER